MNMHADVFLKLGLPKSTNRLHEISEIYPLRLAQKIKLPLLLEDVPAGQPERKDGQIDEYIDLNQFFIRDPNQAYMIRVAGESMIDADIRPGDFLMIDKGVQPQRGDIVIAAINSELTVKRFVVNDHGIRLVPENPKYKTIAVKSVDELNIWGVVTFVIKRARRSNRLPL